MPINFDQIIPRAGTGATKFDGRKAYFGTEDVTPLWVADMDFAVPDCVTDALKKRIEHPVFGYTQYSDSLYQSLIDWFARKHDWKIEREWILMAPGVVPSLFASVQAVAKEGEGVIVQPPVYFPFMSSVTSTHRKLILNPLCEENGIYRMDLNHLETCAQEGARLLMLCSPHNPVGRVWTREELIAVLRIAEKYNLIILSDDIHCDLVFSESKHLMLAKLADELAETDTTFSKDFAKNIMTAVAPNKTFNIPGLGLSALIIPDKDLRKKMQKVFDSLHAANHNPLSMVAFEAAYSGGDEWQKELMNYLQQTRDWVADFLRDHLPQIKLHKPEATYLLWLDCRGLAFSDPQLRDFFIQKAKLGLNPGTVFGEGGSGFMRMNIGCARSQIQEACYRLKAAISSSNL